MRLCACCACCVCVCVHVHASRVFIAVPRLAELSLGLKAARATCAGVARCETPNTHADTLIQSLTVADSNPPSLSLANADTLIQNLTVSEMLMYTAEMKLPLSVPRAEKASRVNELVSFLSLSSCAGTVIGGESKRGISGGQARARTGGQTGGRRSCRGHCAAPRTRARAQAGSRARRWAVVPA